MNDDVDAVPVDTPNADDTWTVARLNAEIKDVLAESADYFPEHVVGEIAEVDAYDFGTFFELRDLEQEPVISCLAWAGTIEDSQYELEEGTKTVVEATVDFYPDRGDCQLLVSSYWPLGASERRQELVALRQKLAEEGLFGEERKQRVPPHPACIGLVTSPTGSAREDAWSAISDRSPRTDVKLCGATVQGNEAVSSLIGAINRLESDPSVEIIIVTRGGGSDVDLWCFNAEPLARCIASCSTPIIVAIGHEDDSTLTEDVADARAMTPTEAGVIATTPTAEVKSTLSTLERRIDTSYSALVEERLDRFERQIGTAFDNLERRASQRESLQQRARDLERRVTVAYQSLVESRVDDLDARIDDAATDIELAAEPELTGKQITRGRVRGLERRIDAAYRSGVTNELERVESRIDRAYSELEAEKRIEVREAEARRLRVTVAILAGVILLVGIALFLLL